MTGSDPVRLGLVGAGSWGRNYIGAIERTTDAALVGIATRSDSGRQHAGPGIVFTSRWEELVSSDGLDGLIVATPPATHCEIARAALEAGKGVLVEKPLSLDAAEARSLLDAATETKGFVVVNHIYLFHAAWEVLKRWSGGKTVRRIEARGGNHGPFRSDCPPLWDYGPHDIAMCLDLMGAPRSSAAQLVPAETGGLAGELWTITMEFDGGASAELTVGNGMERRERRFEVITDDATVVFDDVHDPRLVERDRGGAREIPVSDTTRPLDRATETFVQGIRTGSRDLSSLALGVEVVELLETISR